MKKVPNEVQPSDEHGQIAVVGAGIVGICCALYLQRDGHRVCLIDPDGPGEGCTSGNGGQIVTGYCVPVALPGIVRQVPGMLSDPLGPLTIRWRYLPRLLPWLLRFLGASSRRRVASIASALHELNKDAMSAFEPLIQQASAQDLIERNGRLDVYRSEKAFAKAQVKLNLLRACGVELEILDSRQIADLEPALGGRCRFGLFYPRMAHTTDPLRLAQVLAGDFLRRGGRLLREKVTDFEFRSAGISALRTDAGRHPVDQVVLAAGAFSRPLAAKLGSKVPLDAERGYHVMLPNPGIELRRTLLFGDMYCGFTPMQGGLRLAGTVELASVDAAPNYARADNLLRGARRVLPDLKGDGATRWMGCRPSLPDSLPVLGRSPLHRSVYFAFGHGHVGLTGAAVTGKIIADLVADRPTHIDIQPFRADRF